jgi:hypothetical protein
VSRLRAEVEQRKAEMTRSMMAARDAATSLAEQATAARARGALYEVSQHDRRADAERARMHALLAELATLESELAELERVRRAAAEAPRPPPRAASSPSSSPSSGPGAEDAGPPRRGPSLDDALNDLKKRAGTPGGAPPSGSAGRPKPATASSSRPRDVDDELAALERKMAGAPPKKK